MQAEDEFAEAVESEARFWEELERVVASPGDSSEDIDDALRSYLALTLQGKDAYLQSEYEHARCCYNLLDSPLYQSNSDYVRRQMLYCLLQEDETDTLHLAAAILLYDGRSNEIVFEMMQHEGAFPRLVEMIRDHVDDEAGLHRQLIELLYEMSRMQRLSRDDLVTVDDAFILFLLQLIEQLSDDAEDPYHYPVIRVLLVLNEQYMCLANSASSDSSNAITNRILKVLSTNGPSYRTFGENLILLLNRESALSAQLLILKLLYLLFTTPPTYEYFYTNDLHVLVDVIIRNLLDLDHGSISNDPDDDESNGLDGQRALRHTYLRVLCPLLKNTQLAREGSNYKREEVRKLLHLLAHRSSAHFAPVDETVLRLVIRVKQIDWIKEPDDDIERDVAEIEQKVSEAAVSVVTPSPLAAASPAGETAATDSDTATAIEVPSLNVVADRNNKKRLGMSLDEAGVSSLSVVDLAAAKVVKEKPSVPAPRRNKRKVVLNSKNNNNKEAGNVAVVPRRNGEPHLAVPAVAQAAAGAAATAATDSQGGSGDRSPFADDYGEV